jgi:hypothetical protein
MAWNLLLTLIAQFAPLSSSLPAVPVVDAIEVAAFGPQRSDFAVRFGELRSDYRVMAMFAMPGELVSIQAGEPADHPTSSFDLAAEAGHSAAAGANRWTWTAPSKPGLYPIEIRDRESNALMTLNVFVMVPYASMRKGTLNGYRIGAYPNPRRGHEEEYSRPLGFVEVTPAMLDVQVSPHFRLGQFVCKQAGGPTQYLVLRQPLLVKLEQLLATMNDRGIEARTLSVLSGYRTPSYNAAIGNETTYSRHAYGDAADVYVDDNGDGRMDDLNRDGRHTVADARVLTRIVQSLEGEPESAELVGGLGTYAPTGAHGAFMHVDTRGFSVEWGS